MAERLTPLELMRKLISFPTVSSETNIPLIDWVADYLDGHGIASHRYIDPEQPKHALFAHSINLAPAMIAFTPLCKSEE